MNSESYPDTMSTDKSPPVPWWWATPRDWPERVAAFLLAPFGFICGYNLGGRGPLGIAAAVACTVLALSAFVWWQRRRTPRPRQQQRGHPGAGPTPARAPNER